MMKLAVSLSLEHLLAQNMSFLDFSDLSQQIIGSINVKENLHNAGYIKEIKLCSKPGVNLDVIFWELEKKAKMGELYQKQFDFTLCLK